jgi:Protein of unknown function (DUF2798)
MQRIPRRYSGLVMAVMTVVTMSFVMSFVMTFLNVGFVDNFFQRWMVGFLGALPVGFPVALLVIPIIKAFVDRFTEYSSAEEDDVPTE